MKSLEQRVEEIFAKDGPLSKATELYEPRPSQIEFAKAVARALEKKETLVVEAGTGTGKTFAYLVPALLHEGKILISTAGKTLQDQLFQKDVPAVLKSLGMAATVALLKGRANYVCRYRLANAIANNISKSKEEVRHLQSIDKFSKISQTGERADLLSVPEDSPIWPEVTSNAENCLGEKCEFVQDCFVMKAREKAREASVLVINHHLFLADLTLKDNDISDFLPEFDLIVLDEAHQIPSVATNFFSESLSLYEIRSLVLDAISAASKACAASEEWSSLGRAVANRCDDLILAFTRVTQTQNLKIALSKFKDAHLMVASFKDLQGALEKLEAALAAHASASPDMELASQRTASYIDKVIYWKDAFDGKEIKTQDTAPRVHWFTLMPKNLFFNSTPLTFAEKFTQARQNQGKPWLLTSATLSANGDFSHFNEQMGLTDAVTHFWDSPFDYRQQAMLYIPQELPEPSAAGFPSLVSEHVWPLVRINKGRAFFLCTTLKAMELIAEDLRYRVDREGLDFKVLVQNEMPRKELLRQFRESGNAILVGSMGFWEGVDIKGEALSMVVIDKIPFAPPDDPVFEGRANWLEAQKRNSFKDLSLPEAIMLLKQGAGRLIRDIHDRGLLIICDRRILSKRYGELIWRSLPDFSRTKFFEVALDFVENMNRAPK